MWIAINTQEDLEELDLGVCWEDARVLEYWATSFISPGLPDDVSRSGHENLNLYVLVEHNDGHIELALIDCDRIGQNAFRGFHLKGKVDHLKRVEIENYDESTKVRCSRIAFRQLSQVDVSKNYYG